jgi:hypothetical protein
LMMRAKNGELAKSLENIVQRQLLRRGGKLESKWSHLCQTFQTLTKTKSFKEGVHMLVWLSDIKAFPGSSDRR